MVFKGKAVANQTLLDAVYQNQGLGGIFVYFLHRRDEKWRTRSSSEKRYYNTGRNNGERKL